MPATLETDSWNPTEVITSGLLTSIIRDAKDKAVALSYSLSNSIASSISADMMQARVTDGVKPATAAKANTVGRPRSTVRYRLRKLTVLMRAKRMEEHLNVERCCLIK